MRLGDYTVEYVDGYRPPIVVERKSLNDIYGSLSKGYKRLKRRINEAIKQKIRFIILVEASLTKIGKPQEFSTRNPDEIKQQLFTLLIKHGILFVCCNNPEEAAEWVTQLFIAVGKEHIRDLKEQKKGVKNGKIKGSD